MKKFIWPVIWLVSTGLAVWLGFYVRSRMLDPRATIPKTVERLLVYSVKIGEKEDDDLLYYDTDLSDFIARGSRKTKITVEGVVDAVAPQPDGDYHVIMRSPNAALLVTEFIPEIKLPLPKTGDRIKIWGIVRFDTLHNWWEIHPVIGWKIIGE